ncbi:MAG: ROK family transcriptional regulator [Spirochaetia bacterium]|nr:ROK family transcriptional regulator [Spirochaetia bacterium]
MDRNLPSNYKILHEIWLNPGQSRVQISKKLNIDKSTVSLIINKMLENKIVEENCDYENNIQGVVGRRPIQLKVDGTFGYILGLAIEHHSYKVAIVDFSGKILFSEEKDEIITQYNLKPIIEMLYWKYLELLKNIPGHFLGIGIGVGGLIDHNNGTIIYSVPLEIEKPNNIIESIRKSIPIPVFIENNSNCGAITELVFRKNRKIAPKNLLFLFIEFKHSLYSDLGHGRIGIGLGLVLDGKIHYGSNSFAGEFKSIYCKNQEHFKQLSQEKYNLDKLLEDTNMMQKVVKEIAQNIGFLVNILDIMEIVVGGDIENISSDICNEIELAIKENWKFPISKKINVHYSSLGPETVACGAAGNLINNLFLNKTLPL